MKTSDKGTNGIPPFARLIGDFYAGMVKSNGGYDRDRFLVRGKLGEIADVYRRKEAYGSPWDDQVLTDAVVDVICRIGGKELIVVTGAETKRLEEDGPNGCAVRYVYGGEDLVLNYQTHLISRCFVCCDRLSEVRAWVEIKNVYSDDVLGNAWSRTSARWN